MTDKTVFENIYKENYQKVFSLCLGYTSGNESLARDLTQDTFIKVLNHYKSFRNESKISTWIYRITINTCYRYFRTSKPYTLNIDTPDLDEENKGDIEMKFNSMYACINKLNEQNRSIILLELEDIPQSEIAQIIGISHQALRTRIHRIKEQLTKCVKND